MACDEKLAFLKMNKSRVRRDFFVNSWDSLRVHLVGEKNLMIGTSYQAGVHLHCDDFFCCER